MMDVKRFLMLGARGWALDLSLVSLAESDQSRLDYLRFTRWRFNNRVAEGCSGFSWTTGRLGR